MFNETLFKDQVILITGGSAGLGKLLAKKLLTLGCKVVICGRSQERLTRAEADLKSLGKIMAYPCDVREPHQVRRLIKHALERFGKIDHLVNNAAGNFIRPALKLPERAFGLVVDTVLKGTFNCSRAFALQCVDRQASGSIVNVLATYAWHGGPGTVHSAAAKGGVLAMLRTLAVEWAPYRIRVNGVAPGPLDTRGAEDRLWPDEALKKKVLGATLLKRFIPLEEVVFAIVYLMSPYAQSINGVCLTLDGGDWLGRGILKATGDEIPIIRRKRPDPKK